MPVYLEPGVSYPIVLDSDASKPEESRPTFLAKSQSMRGQKKISDALDALNIEGVTTETIFREVVDALDGVLVGWKNMNGIEFSKEALSDVLSYSEARELLRKVMFNQHITPDEKKSSG